MHSPATTEAASGSRVRRVLGRVVGRIPGPTVVVVGGLHGNEPAGVEALERVLGALTDRADTLRGEVVALAGNLEALAAGRRYVARDLNRCWTGERLAELRSRPAGAELESEDSEQLALLAEIEAAFSRATGPTYAVDLHSTSGRGPAFATVADSLVNRAFALHLPVPIVLGLEEELAGTMLSYLGERGHVTLGFEGGQHQSPAAADNAEAAVWICLAACGAVPPNPFPEVGRSRRVLEAAGRGLPRVVELRHRHAVTPEDRFRMLPGYTSFQPVAAREVVGRDRHGEVRTPAGGRILMPLYQEQGEDGFFIIREFRPLWLWLSGALRRLRADLLVGLLPGVRRHPELRETYVVNRRVARWFALEIFHLLGFRRHGEAGPYLTVARRPELLRVDLSGGRARLS